MALTGLQIFKHLPGGKKQPEANCKKCGFPTCMAYAMKLAKGLAEIDKCEYISDELKDLLTDAAQKQQEEITFGSDSNKIKIGNETVMFRHEKTFVNPPCIGMKLRCDDLRFDEKLNEIASYQIERVGEIFKVNVIELIDVKSCDLAAKAKQITKKDIALIIRSNDFDSITQALTQIKPHKPLVLFESNDIEKIAQIEKDFSVPVVASADNLDSLVDISDSLLKKGVKNIVLNLNNIKNAQLLENLTYIRRAAILDKFKPLGFPILTEIKDSGNLLKNAVFASSHLCRYANIIIFEQLDKALLTALFTLSQNIYTDPQKPLQVEPKLYKFGEVDENSPLMVTTNFALTYFAVANEIESSGVPTYLLITPSDGMSVLTAWSADKFNGEIIAKAIKEYVEPENLAHKKIILPGLVSSLKEELQDELPEWEIIVGTNEAIEIVDYLKSYSKTSV